MLQSAPSREEALESLPDTEDIEDTEAEEDALGLSLAAFLQPSTVLESVPSIANCSYLRAVSTLTALFARSITSRQSKGCIQCFFKASFKAWWELSLAKVSFRACSITRFELGPVCATLSKCPWQLRALNLCLGATESRRLKIKLIPVLK